MKSSGGSTERRVRSGVSREGAVTGARALIIYWIVGGAVAYWIVSRAPDPEVPQLVTAAIAMLVAVPGAVVTGLVTRRLRFAKQLAVLSILAGAVLLVASQTLADGTSWRSLLALCLGIPAVLFGVVVLDRPTRAGA